MQLLLLFVLGLSIGSFCNVCIYRLPIGLDVVTKRSFCPHCRSTLRWFDLIPLLSFVAYRGKCAQCGSGVSFQYPAVELLSGGIVVLVFLEYGFSIAAVRMAFFLLTMLIVAFTDWQKLVIPNQILVISFVGGLLLQLFEAKTTVSSIPLISGSIFSSLVSFTVMLLVFIGGSFVFRKKTMGFGDVKLAAVIGLYIGWQMFLLTLWVAAFVGTLYGIYMILVLKNSKETKLPFGSFIAVAAGLATILAPELESIGSWLMGGL